MDQILNSLITLNKLCDGASSTDGQGYNKIDCCIVPFLLENFNEDAAAVGYTLLKKYTKQLKGLGIEYDNLPKFETKSYREFKDVLRLSKDHNIFTIDEHFVEWQFPYNAEIIAAIKKVPTAKYNTVNKSWKVRLLNESLLELKGVFELFAQLELPSEVRDLVIMRNNILI